jgi:glycerol-3-phosphate dehydrogenase
MDSVGQVAEGVVTAEAALVLARRHGVQIPTFEATDNVIRGRVRPMDAVGQLMERLPRTESILP